MKLDELFLSEMAKRATADAFIAAAKSMLGAEKLKAMKWSDIDAVAKKSELQIPPSIRAMKSGRGVWNLSGLNQKDAPKTEPSTPEKKIDLAHVGRQVFDAFKRHPFGGRYVDSHPPEEDKQRSEVNFEFRNWGVWENPQGEEDEQDYDWQVMTPETRQAARKVCSDMENTFPGINVQYGGGEKNWLEVTVGLKRVNEMIAERAPLDKITIGPRDLSKTTVLKLIKSQNDAKVVNFTPGRTGKVKIDGVPCATITIDVDFGYGDDEAEDDIDVETMVIGRDPKAPGKFRFVKYGIATESRRP